LEQIERVAGGLYGMAIGDSLGVPSSFMTPEYIRKTWGWIDTFYPAEKGHIYHDGLKAGEYTDDSEQAIALIHSFVRNSKVVPKDVVQEIIAWAERVKDKYASPLGPSTARALKAIANGADITQSGRYAMTNGGAMRISPLGMIHGLRGSSCAETVRDVYLACMPTHNTTVCVSAAAAIAWGAALCVRGETSIERIMEGAIEAAELGRKYGYDVVSPSIGRRTAFAYELVLKAGDAEQAMSDVYDFFGGGDLAADSIPAALAMFALGEGDAKSVLEYCANLGGDCDTNGAMAGAMAGAYSGAAKIPQDWKETVSRVNEVDLESYARQLVILASEWEPAQI